MSQKPTTELSASRGRSTVRDSNEVELVPLKPSEIAGLYGRAGSVTSKFLFPTQRAKVRIAVISLLGLATLVALAIAFGVLVGTQANEWAFGIYRSHIKRPTSVRLPLLLDPVGLVVVIAACATPLLCALQVGSIEQFTTRNLESMTYRARELDVSELDRWAKRANRGFTMVGSRFVSLVILVVSAIESVLMCRYIDRHGVLSSWNPSSYSDAKWRHLVFIGWWANPTKHPFFAIVLIGLGTYLIYHLTKQLVMGSIFAVYVRGVLSHNFGVAPNLTVNTDGYYGLRWLRYFMQGTYAACLLDYVLTIGILAVWLPFNYVAVTFIVVVVVTNVTTVLYPTSLAIGGSLLEKRTYVNHLVSLGGDVEARDKAIERVWSIPVLPFRLRSTLSAVSLYFIVPALLAVVSTLIK